jgi:predicted aldo/keto reductase-like oxidoreductase
MQPSITSLIEHMSQSHTQMARVLESERAVAVRMAQLIQTIPNTPQADMAEILQNSLDVTKMVVDYLTNIADLQESLAVMIETMMNEVTVTAEE